MSQQIEIQAIVIDDEMYPRAKLDEDAIDEYARLMKDETDFPPIVVFHHGKEYWLADGRHRLEAARRIGHKKIMANVRKGSRRDALFCAVRANAAHGIRRSNADKRKAVQLLLDDPEWRQWAVSRIAKTCNVSWDLAEAVRKAYLPEPEDSERLVQRGGTVFRQKKRGKKNPQTPVRLVNEMVKLAGEARLMAVESDRRIDPLARTARLGTWPVSAGYERRTEAASRWDYEGRGSLPCPWQEVAKRRRQEMGLE